MGEFWRELHRVVHPRAPSWRPSEHTIIEVGEPDEPPPATVESSSSAPPTVKSSATPRDTRPRSMAPLVAAVAGVTVLGALGLFALSRIGSAEAATLTAGLAAPAAAAATALAATSKPRSPCPEGMTLVPGGTFRLGSDDAAFTLWRPAHDVTLSSFCLDVHEVTVDDYQSCVSSGGCSAAATRPDFPRGDIDEEAHQKNLGAFAELCNYGKPGRGRHPINCVSWAQADGYCRAQEQRLPTEAEWELAVRGNDARSFPWGNDSGDHTYMNAGGLEWQSWLAAHALEPPPAVMYDAEDGHAGTAPVGSFPRGQTQTGQLDMIGNVWEWTADWYEVYDAEAVVNPKGPAGGTRKAIRGGGFNGAYALWMNAAFRYHQVATATSHGIGFRCAAKVARAE
jgi:formylglycine-generating enzyme required for sulfatase activity